MGEGGTPSSSDKYGFSHAGSRYNLGDVSMEGERQEQYSTGTFRFL